MLGHLLAKWWLGVQLVHHFCWTIQIHDSKNKIKKREREERELIIDPPSPHPKKRQRYSTGGLCQAAEAHHPTKMTPPNGQNCLIACSYHLWADLWWTSLIFVRSLSMSTMQGWAVSDNRNVLTFLIPVLEPRLDWFFFFTIVPHS